MPRFARNQRMKFNPTRQVSAQASNPKPKTGNGENPTPAALGFRMPAEWEPQSAVWLSWPHNLRTWPRHFRPIPAKFAEIVAHISRREKVRINVARPLQKRAQSLINKAKA